MSRADNTYKSKKKNSSDYLALRMTSIKKLTFSCLKLHNIFNSLNTRFEETSDWKTFGSFFNATLRPSRGSVTALQIKLKHYYYNIKLG